ncbi:MAG: xylosidase/arabinofuranosidase [Butyrivibrio sp.]|nr:xylosidase/arabinofuranosidase [Butyrivibrio sp.]
MKRRGFCKRGTCALLSASVSAVTLLGGLPFEGAAITTRAAESKVDKTVKINTKDFSTFNDTDGDGLGEFQGFGTSLCWWANRIGYSDELTQQAATYFFDENEGLGLTIGRYNVGGGDNTYELHDNGKKVEVPRNKKAIIMTADRAVTPYTGSNMNCSEMGKFGNARYLKADADFGFAAGDKVGKFNTIGWINELDDVPGSGGNLVFNMDAAATDEYTVKMIFTLSGENSRGVGLKVDRAAVSTESVEVTPDISEAAAEDADVSVVTLGEEADIATEDAITDGNAEPADVTTPDENNELQDGDTPAVEDEQPSQEETETENEPEANEDEQEAPSEAGVEPAKKAAAPSTSETVTEKYEVSGAEVNSDIIAETTNDKLYRVTFKNVKLTEGRNVLTIGGVHDWTLDFVKLLVVKNGDEGVLPEGADEYTEDIDYSNVPNTPFAHPAHIVRSDSAVPGYCVDVTKITDDTDLSAFDRYDTSCGFAWNYDWDADKNQVNVLKAAIAKAGADNFIAEAFSNSPPYFMTVSGCSSGNNSASKDNLREDSVEAFATYMADVVEHWYKEGIIFQSATPMNEPYTDYWAANSDKQEGCHFDIGESQSRIITAFAKKLQEKGLGDVILSASDETSIDTAITSYKALSDEAKNYVTRIDTHTYSGSNRKGLRKLAEESGENLWMSEVDGAFTVAGAGEMSSALGFSDRLITDLNGLMPSAWTIWDIIDTHISDKEDIAANETASKYKEAYNKYDNSDSLEEWLGNNNEKEGKSLWGVAIADHSNQKVVLTKKYYSFGQYSRYIRPGYTLMGSGNDTVAAYDPKGRKIVIVATNKSRNDETWKFNLAGFVSTGSDVTAIRTSGSLENGENWADVSDAADIVVNTSEKYMTSTVKGDSITTYIIDHVVFDKDMEETTPDAKTFTEDEIAANDYMLYLVDCGTTDNTRVPSGYKAGLYQSVTDKEYGADEETGLKWGHAADNENSMMNQTGNTNGSITDTCYYMSDKINFVKGVSGFAYTFDLPERSSNEYEVSVGFKVPSGWGSKKVDIELEGKNVAKQLSISDKSTTEKNYDVTVTDNELNLFVHNPEAGSRGEDPILSYIIVKAKRSKESFKTTYTSFTGVAGEPIYDNNGEMVQAHGGQVQKFTVNGETKYYWYGEDKTYNMDPVTGVHAYSSTDLYNWTDEGVVFKAIPVSKKDYRKFTSADYTADLSIFDTDEYFSSLYGDYKGAPADDTNEYTSKLEEIYWNIADDRTVMERPKVLYNEKTGKYVMWWHCDGFMPSTRNGGDSSQYGKAMVGIATSDSPAGPFKFITTRKLLSADDADLGWDKVKGSSRDMNLFKDDNGKAYVIYSSDGNANMYIAELDDTYTGLAADTEGAKYGENYNMISKNMREAPAMFKYEGRYYLITSGCTGWSPNQASYAVTTDLMSKWTVMGDPCTEDTYKTTYDTQSTCVIPVDPEAGKFIYMGDRWFEDRLKDSRYVWLPIEFGSEGKIAIGKYSGWKLEILDDMGGFTIKTDLPEKASSVEELNKLLPSEISIVKKNGGESTVSVTWNTDNVKEAGEFTVVGTTDNCKKITYQVSIIPSKLIYFFDCAGTEDGTKADFFELAKSEPGNKLRNSVADQAYSEENKAGYSGTLIADDSEKAINDIGIKNAGNGVFEHGYWAGTNKNIDYSFELEEGEYTVLTGYQEWWNTSRRTRIRVTDEAGELATKDFTLASNDSTRVESLSFTVTKKGTVTVSISKKASADPVLSFIGIVKNSEEEAVKPSDEKEDEPNEETKDPQTVTDDKKNDKVETPSDNKTNTEVKQEGISGTLTKVKKGKKKGTYRLKLSDGSYAKGFVNINGKKYYFDKNGYAKKGFHKVKGGKYYTNKKGLVSVGFKKIKGNKYYFNENGKMAKGITQIGDDVYYFGKDGVMRTGKIKIKGTTYNFGKSGKLKGVR